MHHRRSGSSRRRRRGRKVLSDSSRNEGHGNQVSGSVISYYPLLSRTLLRSKLRKNRGGKLVSRDWLDRSMMGGEGLYDVFCIVDEKWRSCYPANYDWLGIFLRSRCSSSKFVILLECGRYDKKLIGLEFSP